MLLFHADGTCTEYFHAKAYHHSSLGAAADTRALLVIYYYRPYSSHGILTKPIITCEPTGIVGKLL